MTTQQQVPAADMQSLEAAVIFLNSISNQKAITIEPGKATGGVVLVTINVPDEHWLFALTVQYGRNIERSHLRETLQIMMEEMKD